MSDTPKIEPALTAEEWSANAITENVERGFSADMYEGILVLGNYDESLSVPNEYRHALAALALYGQPFGFRHHQVSWLREEADILKRASAGAGALICNEIADTIEALLPPVEPDLAPAGGPEE